MRKRHAIGVNILGAVGYLLAVIAWAFLAAVLVALFVDQAAIVPAFVESGGSTPESLPFSSLATGIAYVVTGVMVLLTLAISVLLPYLIGKWSSRALRFLFRLLRIKATKRHMFLAKSIAVVLPLVGFFVVDVAIGTPSMTFSVIYIITVAVSVLALGFFLLQLIIARALRVPDDKIW